MKYNSPLLLEYSNNYSKTSGSLWKYYKDEPALTDAGTIDNFPDNSASFKFKQKITGPTGNDGTNDVEIMVPLKYISSFSRTLGISIINYETNLILTWSTKCFIVAAMTITITISCNNRHKTLCFSFNFLNPR